MVDVYVIGQGPAELAAALEFAEVGLTVRVGRAVAVGRDGSRAESAGGDEADGGFSPDDVTDADGSLRAFLDHVASPLSPGGAPVAVARPVLEPPVQVLLRGADREWTPQPMPAVLGVPAVPLSQASIAVLGRGGATRAFLDRVRPVLTIGKTRSLGTLVRTRIGRKALDRLVEPFVLARFGVLADEVDVAIAVPGLNEDLTTAGSLCGAALAYAQRHVARETRVRPAGGWQALREALLERLALYGVQVADAPVTSLRSIADDGDREAHRGEHWMLDESGNQITARAVVLGDRAVRLPGALSDAVQSDAVLTDAALGERQSMRWIADAAVTEPDFGGHGLAGRDPADSDASGELNRAALEIVTAPNGDCWSVRWERTVSATTGAEWRIRMSGPAFSVDDHHSENVMAPQVLLDDLMHHALEAVGARRVDGARMNVQSVPAPFATVEARDAARLHTTSVRAGESTCIRVGPEVHSGDIAAAVSDAREVSVHMRRRLTGIAE
ncbi:hypothetical protein [Leucobacter sp. NPDC077196]|uniref:hypothetical protein n=1 Tax=Leucobacter sp. NPDC077196 TaxID=3154959 RepID=UPI003428A930